MDPNPPQQNWQAKVSSKVEKVNADQIWTLFQDFFGLHKWFPGLPNCHGIHGVNGEPGCIRYCSGFGLKKPVNDNGESRSSVSWSKERLLDVDRDEKTFSYEMVDCNIGFESYVATIKVVPRGEGGGCSVEWSIVLDPVEGWRLEDLVPKYQLALELLLNNMEASILGLGSS